MNCHIFINSCNFFRISSILQKLGDNEEDLLGKRLFADIVGQIGALTAFTDLGLTCEEIDKLLALLSFLSHHINEKLHRSRKTLTLLESFLELLLEDKVTLIKNPFHFLLKLHLLLIELG